MQQTMRARARVKWGQCVHRPGRPFTTRVVQTRSATHTTTSLGVTPSTAGQEEAVSAEGVIARARGQIGSATLPNQSERATSCTHAHTTTHTPEIGRWPGGWGGVECGGCVYAYCGLARVGWGGGGLSERPPRLAQLSNAPRRRIHPQRAFETTIL